MYMYIHMAYETQTPYHCANSMPQSVESFHCDMKQPESGISYRLVLNVYNLWMILRKVVRIGRVRCMHKIPIIDITSILDICLLFPLLCMQKCKFPFETQHKHVSLKVSEKY